MHAYEMHTYEKHTNGMHGYQRNFMRGTLIEACLWRYAYEMHTYDMLLGGTPLRGTP
jgi:hypothetical protein